MGAAGSKLKRVRNAHLKNNCSVLMFAMGAKEAAWNAKAYRASMRPGTKVRVVKAKTMPRAEWAKVGTIFNEPTTPGKSVTHVVVGCLPKGSTWRKK